MSSKTSFVTKSFVVIMFLIVSLSYGYCSNFRRFPSYQYENKTSTKETSERNQHSLNLKVTRPSQVRYGERSLRVLGPKIWNNLPAHVKSATNLLSFKRLMQSWDGVSCKCTLCKKL